MSERATVTIHTSPENKARLARLAEAQDRTVSYLGGVALTQYLDNEEKFVAGVLEGLAQSKQGAGYSSDEIREHLHGVIDGVGQQNRA